MNLRRETIAATPWLALKNVFVPDPHGAEKAWTYATRPNCAGAVCVIALTKGRPREILLVRQYRAPVGAAVIELPAGLIDPGESPGQAALRELAEETGWRGTVEHVGPATYSSAGLTDEAEFIVELTLTSEGKPRPDDDEQIEVLRWPLDELCSRLEAAAAGGDGIDSKLWTYALSRGG